MTPTRVDDTITIPVARPAHWPAPPKPAAFYGLAGDIARASAPHTEADPIAVLAQLLVAYGTVIGRGAHRLVGASQHHSNEFVLLVGPSAKARKGTSWDLVEELIAAVDPSFVDHHVHSGLSSGEGLIDKVRDPLYDTGPGNEPIVKTPGIDDKRMLVLESEFALVLRVLAREGNTLSAVVRNCWDGRTLQTMTKNTPARATRPHISIIGHITADELLRYLTTTELASGFINRFLIVAVRRTQLLPDGGDLAALDWASLTDRLAAAVDHGRIINELTVTPEARDRWRTIYPQVSVDHPGLFGAATARAEAHVVRLALLYAPYWTALTASSESTSMPPVPCGATPAAPLTGCSATPWATRSRTTSGRPSKPTPTASPSRTSGTCSPATKASKPSTPASMPSSGPAGCSAPYAPTRDTVGDLPSSSCPPRRPNLGDI
jgi:hypothetical protein